MAWRLLAAARTGALGYAAVAFRGNGAAICPARFEVKVVERSSIAAFSDLRRPAGPRQIIPMRALFKGHRGDGGGPRKLGTRRIAI